MRAAEDNPASACTKDQDFRQMPSRVGWKDSAGHINWLRVGGPRQEDPLGSGLPRDTDSLLHLVWEDASTPRIKMLHFACAARRDMDDKRTALLPD